MGLGKIGIKCSFQINCFFSNISKHYRSLNSWAAPPLIKRRKNQIDPSWLAGLNLFESMFNNIDNKNPKLQFFIREGSNLFLIKNLQHLKQLKNAIMFLEKFSYNKQYLSFIIFSINASLSSYKQIKCEKWKKVFVQPCILTVFLYRHLFLNSLKMYLHFY